MLQKRFFIKMMAVAMSTVFMGASAMAGGLITIIVNNPANPYWYTEGEVAAKTAKSLGYSASVSAHKGDTNTESNLIDTAITNKSVAIILDPADANGSIGAIKKAVKANIPVFLVNAEINQEGLAKGQLVSNNAQGAALGAQEWVRIAGEKGRYVELFGHPSDNNAATRSNGYKTVIGQYPGWKKVGKQVANWDRTMGHDKMQILLQSNPDMTGLIAGNDEMALGAISALEKAGKLDQVVVGGFDGSPDAVDAIKAGKLAYTVLQPVAVFSEAAVRQAHSYITTGKTGAKSEKQLFDCLLINKGNVHKYTAPFVLSN